MNTALHVLLFAAAFPVGVYVTAALTALVDGAPAARALTRLGACAVLLAGLAAALPAAARGTLGLALAAAFAANLAFFYAARWWLRRGRERT